MQWSTFPSIFTKNLEILWKGEFTVKISQNSKKKKVKNIFYLFFIQMVFYNIFFKSLYNFYIFFFDKTEVIIFY